MSVTYIDGVPSADLLRLQALLMTMCERLLAYCREKDIPIFLIGGTALGALRDKQMIPWDDDIDLALLRPDYERLMRALEHEPIAGMTLQHWRTEPDYPYPFAKLRLDGTSAGEVEFAGTGMHEGIFLDIFPYDRLPAGDRARTWQRRILGLLNYVILPRTLHAHFEGKSGFHGILRRMGLVARAVFPLRWFSRAREKVQLAASATPSDEFDSFGMLGISQWRKKVLRESDLVPLRPAQLGPLSAHMPANCERFCELHYGPNWREPPPEDQRRPAHVGRLKFPNG